MISSPRAELNRYFHSLSLELSAKKCIAHKHCFFNKKNQFIAHKHCFSAKKHSKEQFVGNQLHTKENLKSYFSWNSIAQKTTEILDKIWSLGRILLNISFIFMAMKFQEKMLWDLLAFIDATNL